MAEQTAARGSALSDGLFYTLMSFILVGTIGLGIGFAYGAFHGAGWNGGIMVAAIVAGIGGTILAALSSGRPLPAPNTVTITVPAAPTVARSTTPYPGPSTPSAHDLGVTVGAAIATAKERVQSAVETVAEKTGIASDTTPDTTSEVAPKAADERLPESGVKPASLAAPREGGPDDLKRIKGIGPRIEEMLHGLGFYHFDQIAAWTPDEIAWVDTHLEGFHGRATRDDWVGQARLLASGDDTGFSKRVDDGEVY